MRLSLKVSLIVVGIVLLIMTTMFIGLTAQINRQQNEAMLATAKAIYQNVLLTRKWVSDQGGVLVKKQADMKANPFLAHPILLTKQGDTLLVKNPALVTRELSSISIAAKGNFTYHLASDRFLNPVNRPDVFEKQALNYYLNHKDGQSEIEYYRLENVNGKPYFRYFAPLYTEKSCLSCHASQGYKEGDLRGGLSVLINAEPYLQAKASNSRFLLSISFGGMILLSVLLYLSLQHSIIAPLQSIKEQTEQISEGNYSFDFDDSGRDEIASLSRSIRSMGERIQKFTNRITASEAKYRSILENSPESVITIDPQGNIIDYNENFVRLCSSDTASKLHENIYSCLDNNGRRKLKSFFSQKKGKYQKNKFESKLVFKNKKPVSVEISITPDISLEGRNDLAFLYLHDLSDREQMENLSIQTEKMVALGRLSAGIAHEIRNPLFAMNNNVSYLQQNIPEQSTLSEIIPEIKSAMKRIESIISNVLDYARPHKPKYEKIDLNQVIIGNLDLLKKHLDKSRIELQCDLSQNLRPIIGDAHQLGQVIINLAMNAVQAMNDRGKLEISTRNSGHFTELMVRDNGCGIPEDEINQIFDPFFTRSQGGTGLGLSVTQSILEQHQAKYQVTSETDIGTTFIIKFDQELRQLS